MRNFWSFNTVAAAVLLCALGAASAQTGDPGSYRIDADKNTVLDFGDSWRRSALAPAGESCVEVDLNNAEQGNDGGDSTSYTLATTAEEIADQMSLSVDAKFSGVTPSAMKVTAHASVDFINSFKTTSSSVSLIVKASRELGTVRLKGVKLKEKYVKMLNQKPDGLQRFERECGDGFVIGKKQGAMFVGVANANSKSTESHSKFDMAIGGGLENPANSFEASVGFGKAMSKAFGSKNITVDTYGNYDFSSGEKASTPEELEQIWKKWKPGNNVSDISYLVADYKRWVTNWPESQKNTPWKSVKEEELEQAVSAAWDLMTLVEEADFTISNQPLFALGLTKKVRDREVNRIKGLKDKWTKQKREAAIYAEALMEKGNSGAKKKKPGWLSKFVMEEARGELPVRYTNDCKGISIPLTQLAAPSKGTMIDAPHHNGDKNLGGKGVLARGEFKVKLDSKGKLSGRFTSLSFRECKKHKRGKKKGKCNKMFKTEFKVKKALPSFDAPMAKANPQFGDIALAGCSLGRSGTKTIKFKKYFKKFGRSETVSPEGKSDAIQGLKCNLDKKSVKQIGAVQCEVFFGQLTGFVSSADLALEKDGKKARAKRKSILKKRAKKGRAKTKKRKKGLAKFFSKKAKGKKVKAKRGKKKKGKKKSKKAKKKAKKKCKKKCKKLKGKKKKSCLKKCK